MSTIESAIAMSPNSRRGIAARLRAAAVRHARRLWARYLERRAIAELSGLDDRALKDIGLSRSLIPFIARDGIAAAIDGARRR